MKLKSINPHDQSVIGGVEVSTKKSILESVAKAQKAFTVWSSYSFEERTKPLKLFRQKIVEHRDELAKLVSLEMGKPISQSQDDINFELEFIDYYINDGPKALADKIVLTKEKQTQRIVYEPYGVCAVIAPWNFPLAMFDSGVLPALVAGNTVVFKPSEYCTLSQKRYSELLLECGLPSGVFNFVIGSKDVGKMLVDAPVDLVWFTGSTKAGLDIYKKCGEKFIKAICEMGGSSAGIVFADADLNLAMDNLYWARFLNGGQVCSAIKRLFVEKPVFNQVVKMFSEKLKSLKIGNPLDNPDFGPLVFPEQVVKLEKIVKDALFKGAKIEIGGKKPTTSELKKGNYFEPTILTRINSKMRVMTEEVFGPVLPIVPFNTEEEVIKMANDTEYGLSSEVYTSDIQKGERVAQKLQSGVVAINTDSYFHPQSPFGGYKKSGMGREYGEVGMQEFCQIKTLVVHN